MVSMQTPNGELKLPAFLPDATRAVVRSLDAADLEAVGVPGLVVCAYHLMQRPGTRTVAGLGGLHELMDWRRPILVDSGGFQVFSLIHENPKLGSITNKHAVFRAAEGRKTQRLSPEKSIQVQLRLGADILVCFDDCTHPDVPRDEQAASVARTIAWARRCKDEFERGLDARGRSGRHRRGGGPGRAREIITVSRETVTASEQPCPGADGHRKAAVAPPRGRSGPEAGEPARKAAITVSRETVTTRPLLFGVVQGGNDRELRRRCAEALLEIGFDGYAFGGWPFDRSGRFLHDILAYTAELLPAGKPKYAMGIGNPGALVACSRMGYSLFDCALPTRDARRGRLYLLRSGAPADVAYDRLYIRDDDHHRDPRPVSEHCDCPCCRRYSRAYLHHLFAVGDRLAWRLATLHNLRFYTLLIGRLGRPAD